MEHTNVRQHFRPMALALVAVPIVGWAAGVKATSPVGDIDTRRPVLQTTETGKLDTRPLGMTIIFR